MAVVALICMETFATIQCIMPFFKFFFLTLVIYIHVFHDNIHFSQIITMLKDRLILPSCYAAVKIAGLYLLSDILHNAGAPIKHAANYR